MRRSDGHEGERKEGDGKRAGAGKGRDAEHFDRVLTAAVPIINCKGGCAATRQPPARQWRAQA